MCGIFLTSPSNIEITERALDAHRNRGPDDEKVADLGFCSFGVNRLAITDLDNGDQPIWSADGKVALIFNGAIYNSEDLCTKFEFLPETGNDGEVIHYLYQKFGLKFADYLEGMYSIILVDVETKDVYYCVDRVGIKPLYKVEKEGIFILSSTLQAIPNELRPCSRRVPSGVVWSMLGSERRFSSSDYAMGSLVELLRLSVKQQIPREVRWACMLSGGVDSSLIAALASEFSDDVHTFTCGTAGSSDLVAARSVSQLLGTIHHEVDVDLDELPQVVEAVVSETGSFEMWTIMGGVGTYLTARAARREGFKVLLSGEGADELFAGYDEFNDVSSELLEQRLLQYQADLSVSECLRLDRTTMANSIEARVPFLSRSIIEYARRIDSNQKLERSGGMTRRKAVLRDQALQVLPRNVAERVKVEFKDGSGLASHLYVLGSQKCTLEEVDFLAKSYPSFGITNAVQAWLLQLWLNKFGYTIGADCAEMRARGIIRQEVNDYLRPVWAHLLTGGTGSIV